MKRKIQYMFAFLVIMSGVVILAWPYVSFWLDKQNQSYVSQEYDDTAARMTEEQLKNEWERAVAYNENLTVNTLYDSFTAAEAEVDDEYLSLLNLNGDGIMGRIEIPRIDVELPIFHGTSAKVLENGVGHMGGTALPVGGTGMHAVLTGHTGLGRTKLFTDLIELETGDEFYIRILDKVLAYQVVQIQVVLPEEVEPLLPVEDKDLVTLVTCTPYGVNSHRLLVQGERTAYSQAEIDQRIAETDSIISRETLMLFAALALIFIIILILLIRKIPEMVKRRRCQKLSEKSVKK